jgi:hypothetical protein
VLFPPPQADSPKASSSVSATARPRSLNESPPASRAAPSACRRWDSH